MVLEFSVCYPWGTVQKIKFIRDFLNSAPGLYTKNSGSSLRTSFTVNNVQFTVVEVNLTIEKHTLNYIYKMQLSGHSFL